MTDGWRLKKRARDPEAAEQAWNQWLLNGKAIQRTGRGMSHKTAEAHPFCKRMQTIVIDLQNNAHSLSAAANVQHACDELRDLFVNNKDFLLRTDYVNGEEKANRLRLHSALLKLVLHRFDEFEKAFEFVLGDVPSKQMQVLRIQKSCLRDALPPHDFLRGHPQHDERDALERLTLKLPKICS